MFLSSLRPAISLISILLAGCSLVGPVHEPHPPLTILVAQVTMKAPIAESAEIYTFASDSDPDRDQQLLVQLIQEIEIYAQRQLTKHLAAHPDFRVIPFEEARRMRGNVALPGQPLTHRQLAEVGREAGADIVVSAHIDDYGRLGWHHWAAGWFSLASAHTTIVGAVTAWNPLAMGGYLAYDLVTDLPLWYSGFSVLGWAFRPVHIILDADQIAGCKQREWIEEEVVILAGRRALAAYPLELRERKDFQLQVNLDLAMRAVAEAASQQLRLKPCPNGQVPP